MAPETTSINSNDKTNYWLIAVVFLTIACLLLSVVIIFKYYMKHRLTIPWLLNLNSIMRVIFKIIIAIIKMISVKQIDIKNRTYYYFNNLINIKNLDLNKVKVDENSCKNILTVLDTRWSETLAARHQIV